jgi:hypothetical protein
MVTSFSNACAPWDPNGEEGTGDCAHRVCSDGGPHQGIARGFLVHLAKPVDSSELVATVASVTGRVP